MRSEPAAISVRGVTKRYGRLLAVDDLTLDVHEGEVFGFLGLNGAGKTTTIRILLDLLRPTAGTAAIFGHDCRRNGRAARAHLGYLPGEIRYHDDLTGEQVLAVLGRLEQRPPAPEWRRMLLDRFEFPAEDLRRPLREYSAGMKRKLGIVQALQADATLLILDEPTEGLDPLMREAFYDLLSELRRRGRTVFMSSHILPEVERVCDRIGVLRSGTLGLLATVDEIRRLAPRRVQVIFHADLPASLPPLPDTVQMVGAMPRQWSLRVQGPLGPLLDAIATLPLADLRVEEPRLEDVVIDYYREVKR